jgi:hypothetical protein
VARLRYLCRCRPAARATRQAEARRIRILLPLFWSLRQFCEQSAREYCLHFGRLLAAPCSKQQKRCREATDALQAFELGLISLVAADRLPFAWGSGNADSEM